MVDCGPDDVGVPRHPESIPGSEEAMVTSLCHRLRLLGGWEGQEEKRGLGGRCREEQPHRSVEGWEEKRDAVKEWTQDPPAQHIIPSPTPTPSLRKRPVGFKPHLPPPPPLPHLEGVGTHKENVKNAGASNECVPETQRLASAFPFQTQEIRPQPSSLRPTVQALVLGRKLG